MLRQPNPVLLADALMFNHRLEPLTVGAELSGTALHAVLLLKFDSRHGDERRRADVDMRRRLPHVVSMRWWNVALGQNPRYQIRVRGIREQTLSVLLRCW